MNAAMPALKDFERGLPPGYKMEIGGERGKGRLTFRERRIVILHQPDQVIAASHEPHTHTASDCRSQKWHSV